MGVRQETVKMLVPFDFHSNETATLWQRPKLLSQRIDCLSHVERFDVITRQPMRRFVFSLPLTNVDC